MGQHENLLVELQQYNQMLTEELITQAEYDTLKSGLLTAVSTQSTTHSTPLMMSPNGAATMNNGVGMNQAATQQVPKQKDDSEVIETVFSVVFAFLALWIVPILFGTAGVILGILVRAKNETKGSVLIALNIGLALFGVVMGAAIGGAVYG